MTPEQALDLLAQATGNLPLSRKDHQLILNAIQVLSDFIKKEAINGSGCDEQSSSN